MFSEEPIVEEGDFASHTKHQESHSEVEDSKDDYVYEATCDNVIPTKIVDLVVFVDDSENKHANVAVLNDVSDSLSEQETIDSSIEVETVAENEQQPLDRSSKETTTDNPPQNYKTRSLREIYEPTPLSDEHLQYALFSSQPTFFEEAMKDAQWVHGNEKVNENDEVAPLKSNTKM